jgi:MFS family permease
LACFVAIVAAWGTYRTFGIFFEPVSKEFGWTRAMTSGAFSLSTVLNGLFSIVMGRLTDRFGPRVVMSACGLFLGLGYFLMSQLKSVSELYLFYGVIVAIGMSAAYVPIVSTVARWFVKKRTLMTGIVISGMGVGMVIMAPLASQFIRVYEWRISYIIIAMVAVIFIILPAQFLRRDPREMEQLPYGFGKKGRESLNAVSNGLSLKQTAHTKQFWSILVMFLSLFFCLEAVMVHVVIDATGWGVSPTDASKIISIIGGLSIAGKIIMGGIADRIGNKKALSVGFIIVSLALAFLATANDLWMFYAFAATFGFSYGGLITVFPPIAAEMFGLTSHGVIMGIVTFGGTVGGAIGTVSVGKMFDMTGSYSLGFLVCTCAAVMGTVLSIYLKPIPSETDSLAQ